MPSPKVRQLLAVTLVTFAVLASSTPPAAADQIVQIHAFDTTSTGGAGLDFLGIQPFDPAMGTLDVVGVSIIGSLTVTGTAAGGPFTVRVSQDFFGLAGKFFDFSSPAQLLVIGSGVAGQPATAVATFSYSFQFNQATDLFGFTVPTVGGLFGFVPTIGGTRANFLTTVLPINEIDVVQLFELPLTSGITPLTHQSQGALTITYDFTPAAVPEPGSLVLLTVGSVSALAYGWRRRIRMASRIALSPPG